MRWIVAIACSWAISLGCSGTTVEPTPPPTGYSNVYAADYVGPARCGECHEENYAHWRDSLHATMNRRADEPGAVWGDFDDAELAYGGGTARFTREDGAAVMSTVSAAGVERRYRVTRTIGSRYLQEYVGVQVRGPEPIGDPIYTTELRLPFGSWKRAGGWVPRAYFDSWYPPEWTGDHLTIDPYEPDDEPWATRCAWCHNTYPFELRAVRPLGHGLEQFVEVAVPRRDATAIVEDNLLPVDELVTVGISCESCHLGGREHAEHEEDISFTPRSSDLVVSVSGGRDSPLVVQTICATCHSTPSPRWPNLAAVRNSSEAIDLQAGACASQIKCTDCHDPHVSGPGPGAPDQPAHLAACDGCHDVATDHSHHDASVTCLDCHMPRIVQGLSAMVRSHRISSPSDASMLTLATPNACNLCHLDRSLTWTLDRLTDLWSRPPVDDAVDDGPLGPRWLASTGALRITAAHAYARSPLGPSALPLIPLDDPVAFDRTWLRFAAEDLKNGDGP